MTVLERFLRAGIPEHTARRHLRYGRVRVRGAAIDRRVIHADSGRFGQATVETVH
jgi:hypothetical protein